jgi:hypothetical protein
MSKYTEYHEAHGMPFRVVVVEDYNSTTSALFLYSFFGYSIVMTFGELYLLLPRM